MTDREGCRHTDQEIREMAYQVWLKDQTLLIEQALEKETLDALAEENNDMVRQIAEDLVLGTPLPEEDSNDR